MGKQTSQVGSAQGTDIHLTGTTRTDAVHPRSSKTGDPVTACSGGRREVRTPVKRLVWNLRQEMMVAWTWAEQAVKVLRVV